MRKLLSLLLILSPTSAATAQVGSPAIDLPYVMNTADLERDVVDMYADSAVAACVYAGKTHAARGRYSRRSLWKTSQAVEANSLAADICSMPGHKGVMRFVYGSAAENLESLAAWAKAALAVRPDLGFVAVVYGTKKTVVEYFDRQTGTQLHRIAVVPLLFSAVRLTPWGMCRFKNVCPHQPVVGS